MTRLSLSQTLTALIEGVTPDHPGLAIEEAEIRLPLLVRLEHGPDGPVLTAQPPYSAFHAGIDPVAHHARIRIEPEAQQTVLPITQPVTQPAPNPAPEPAQ